MTMHHLPSIRSISDQKQATTKLHCNASLSSAQKLPTSSSKTKIRIRRPSSGHEVKKGQEMVRLPMATIRVALDGLLLLL